MPGFDGTGPAGLGPMTGRGRGYCVLERARQDGAGKLAGFAGMDGRPVEVPLGTVQDLGMEGTNMPRGDGTGPAGMGPMTGRAAGYCAGYGVPGYVNPIAGRAAPYVPTAPYGAPVPYAPAPYGYSPYGLMPYGRGGGRGFGRGFGRGLGRGRGGGRRW